MPETESVCISTCIYDFVEFSRSSLCGGLFAHHSISLSSRSSFSSGTSIHAGQIGEELLFDELNTILITTICPGRKHVCHALERSISLLVAES